MPYIGQSPASKLLTASDITDGVISTAKLADSSVSTAKLADDSVGNTKLDLSADYAFSGTVTGVGGLVKLNTTDITSSTASLVFNSSLITSTYDKYIMEYTMLKPVTDAAYFRVRVSADNGSSFVTGSYNYGFSSTRMGASTHTGIGSTKTDYAVTDFQWGNETNTAGHGKYILEGFNDSNAYFSIQHIYVVHNFNSQWYYVREAWGMNNVANPNYAEWTFSSGNIADGTFTLYGLAK